MPLLALKLISDPKAWIAIAFLFYSGFVFTQGRNYEIRKQARAIEAANARVAESNARYDALANKIEADGDRAVTQALAPADRSRCPMQSQQTIASLNKI